MVSIITNSDKCHTAGRSSIRDVDEKCVYSSGRHTMHQFVLAVEQQESEMIARD